MDIRLLASVFFTYTGRGRFIACYSGGSWLGVLCRYAANSIPGYRGSDWGSERRGYPGIELASFQHLPQPSTTYATARRQSRRRRA